LPEFTRNQAVRLTLGRTENVLDFQDIFENQKILLCNLSQRGMLDKSDADMLGVLLLNEMFSYSLKRDEEEAKDKPFFLIIDEFQNFISPDLASMLDQCRKFGLHLVLSHQRLGQLKEKDPDLYEAVMGNARTKVIFSVTYKDADIIEKEVFAGEHNLKELKDELYRTAVLDYIEDKKIIRSHGEGSGRFEGSGLSSMTGPSFTQMPGLEGDKASYTDTSTQASTSGVSENTFKSETEVPILIPQLGKELSSREFYSLEEQRYKNAVSLKKQNTQRALIKELEDPIQKVFIKTVKTYKKDIRKQEEVERISNIHQGNYYLPPQETIAMTEERQGRIEKEEEIEYPAKFRE